MESDYEVDPVGTFFLNESEEIVNDSERIVNDQVNVPEKPSKYNAHRKKFFLTYPKCTKTPEELFAFLDSKHKIDRYLIARELHKDGDYHLHAFIEFQEKQHFTNARWADFDGYHPNDGGAVRNDRAVSRYVTKDGNYISNYYKIDPYTLIYDKQMSHRDAVKLIMEERPRDYTLYGEQIERSIKRVKFAKDTHPGKFKLTDYTRPPLDLTKSVLLWGPSGIGKTQYALAHFTKPLCVRHLDDLKKLSPDNDGIVFDDMSFNHLPSDTIIYLLDMELDSPIHCRNTNAIIPAGTKRIFTHNSSNIFYPDKLDEERRKAIDRRVLVTYAHQLK